MDERHLVYIYQLDVLDFSGHNYKGLSEIIKQLSISQYT